MKERLARWRATLEAALGLTDTATLPDLSESDVRDIKRRTTRLPESE